MVDVKEIIGDVPDQELNKPELEDSFEIELNGQVYYTLLDMEDGNYIAIDRSRRVFQMHHDSNEQAKEIYPLIEAFLEIYNGDKDTLDDLFN